MIRHLFSMPIWLSFLVMLGLLAPFVTAFSLLNNGVEKRYLQETGSLLIDPVSAVLVILFTLPLLISSAMMIFRKSAGRYWCVLGHILINISPILISIRIAKTDVFIIEFSFYLLLILIIALYIFRNKDVKIYFLNTPATITIK